MFQRIDLLSAAKGSEQDMLLHMMKEVWATPGELIGTTRGTTAWCFLIISGFVRIEDVILGSWLLPPGALFGLEEMFMGGIPTQHYRAACHSTMLAIDRTSLTGLLSAQHPVAQNLQAEIALIAGRTIQRRMARLAARL